MARRNSKYNHKAIVAGMPVNIYGRSKVYLTPSTDKPYNGKPVDIRSLPAGEYVGRIYEAENGNYTPRERGSWVAMTLAQARGVTKRISQEEVLMLSPLPLGREDVKKEAKNRRVKGIRRDLVAKIFAGESD